MAANLQPIVAIRQQPEVGLTFHSMQPMVVAAKDKERREFARELAGALDEMGIPPRGRAIWLSKQMRKAGVVISAESCRKWLSGLSLPDQANLRILSKILEGRVAGAAGGVMVRDGDLRTVVGAWSRLQDKAKGRILQIIDDHLSQEK